MILTVFSTLLSVHRSILGNRIFINGRVSRYFTERGSWDSVLETFVNADGDPTQFSVCGDFKILKTDFST